MSSLSLLDSQFFFLMLQQIREGTPLVYSARFKGSVGLEEFQNAVQSLIDTNPILQFTPRFPQTASSFAELRMEKLSHASLPIEWLDLTDQSVQEQEATIETAFHKGLNKTSDFELPPLYSFHLYKLNADQFHFIMNIAHVICDGLGSLQLLHQFFSYLSKTTDFPKQTVEEYNQVAEQISHYHPSSSCLSTFEMMNAKIKKDSFEWNPDSQTPTLAPPDFYTIRAKLDRETTKRLIQLTSNLRISFYSIIVTAYLDYLFSTTSSDRVILTLPTSGKVYPHFPAIELVGCFAQAISLSFDRTVLQKPIQTTLQMVHEEIHSALSSEADLIQNQKLAHSVKSNFKLTNGKLSDFSKALFRSTIKSNVYLSFTGYSPLHLRYGELEITDYKEGTFNNGRVSDWMHTIFDEELYLFANYDSQFFSKTTIEIAIQHLQEKLSQISRETFLAEKQATPAISLSEGDETYNYLISCCNTIGLKDLDVSAVHYDLEGQLGLDSLSRIRLIAKINRDHNDQVPINSLFKCRTIYEFANVIKTIPALR